MTGDDEGRERRTNLVARLFDPLQDVLRLRAISIDIELTGRERVSVVR
jgi:hypothetical protein